MNKEKQIEEMADILCEAKEHDCKGGNDCLCLKQAEALYDAGYRNQEWISVKDRLPKETAVYLTISSDGDIEILLFNSRNDPYQTYSAMFNKFLFCDKSGDWHSTNRVTHWMHLPEPPK